MSASVQWASPSPSTSINNIKSHLYHKLKQKLFKVKEVRDMKIVRRMSYPKYYLWYFAHLYSKPFYLNLFIIKTRNENLTKTATENISELEISQSNLTYVCSVLHFTKPFFAASISSTFDIPNTWSHSFLREKTETSSVEFYFKCKEKCVHGLHWYFKFSCIFI